MRRSIFVVSGPMMGCCCLASRCSSSNVQKHGTVTAGVESGESSSTTGGSIPTRHGKVGALSQGAYAVNKGREWGSEVKQREAAQRSIGHTHRRAMTMAQAALRRAVSVISSKLGNTQ